MVKEAQRRDLEKNQKENGYWLSQLQRAYYEKVDMQELTQPALAKRIEELDSKNLQQVAQKCLRMDNRVVVIMNPEKEK
jgi:predicted Zn-dependent peptidase